MKEIFKKIVLNILYWESKLVLKFKKPKIIAITGTVGKTTTKEIIFAGLKDYFEVRKSPKGFNSDIGVLLSILDLSTEGISFQGWLKNIFRGLTTLFRKDYPRLLILEVGANYPGEISKNAKLLQSDIVVFTRLPQIMAHMEFFRNREHFIQEKMSLAEEMKNDGVIIYNGDDTTLRKELSRKKFANCQKISFGKNREVSFQNVEIVRNNNEIIGTEIKTNQGTVLLKKVLGKHLAYPVTALIAVAKYFELNPRKVLKSLEENFTPPPGRMRIFKGENGEIIIDDSYNALPESVKNGAELLKEIDTTGRKIYVLGRLAELGKYTEKSYRKALEAINNSAEIIFLVNNGGMAKKIADKMNFKEVHSFNRHKKDYLANTGEAGEFLKQYLRPNDVVVFKGARHSTGFESAIVKLIAEKDKKYLVQDYI